MKKEDIRNTFDSIEPSEMARQKMLHRVLKHKLNQNEVIGIKTRKFRKVIPAFALTLVLIAGVMFSQLDFISNPMDSRSRGEELALHEIKDQFQMGDKHYILLSETLRSEFMLPNTVTENDLGQRIATIQTSVDQSLIGLDVYEYVPAGGKAVVAVKKENGYSLFRFYNFDSYLNNQDEDARVYLELHGIFGASDIARVQFINRSDDAKIANKLDIIAEITTPAKIAEFYAHYSVMQNASDRYFDKLFNFNGPASKKQTEPRQNQVEPSAPDYLQGAGSRLPAEGEDSDEVHYAEDTPAFDSDAVGNTDNQSNTASSGSSTSGSTGSAAGALINAITIRIYNQNGLYFEAEYYPNISFISRHEVSPAFAEFLKGITNR